MSVTADENNFSTPSSSSSKGPVILPTDNDVLCGRGGGILAHPGNIFYRSLVDGKKREYISCRFKREKRSIAVNIVKEIRSRNGKFLTKNNGEWNDIGDIKAQEKTLQALREDAKQVRKKIEEEEAAELEKVRQRMMRDEDDARRNAQAKAIADREMQERGYYWPSRPQPPPPPPCICTSVVPPQISPTCVACTGNSIPYYPHPAHQIHVPQISYPHNVFFPSSSPYTTCNKTEGNEDACTGGSAMPRYLSPPHAGCSNGHPHFYTGPLHHQPPPTCTLPGTLLPLPPPPPQADGKLRRKGGDT